MKMKFNVTGMTCAACSARVEKVSKAVPGVDSAEVNLIDNTTGTAYAVVVESGRLVLEEV